MKNKIDYGSILKRSWSLVWNNHFMWMLGFFIVLGSSISTVSFEDERGESFSNYFQEHIFLATGLFLSLVVICVLLYVLSILSHIAVIKGATETKIYAQMKFTKIITSGRSFFWRLLLLDLIFFFFLFGVTISIILPIVMLFSIKAFVIGVLMSLFAVVILIPVLIGAYFIKKFAVLSIVLANLKIRRSIEFGYATLVSNFKKSFVLGVFMVAISCLIFISIFAITFTLIVQSILAGIVVYFLFGFPGIVPIILILLFLLFAGIFFVASLKSSWVVVVWTLFFREISALKSEEKVNEIREVENLIESIQPEGCA